MSKYVYPKFSEHEFPGVRLAGPGLGNLLFIYARALKFASESKAELIWPTWRSLRIGTWIRKEPDKRTYHNLFENNCKYIDGLKKYWILLTHKKNKNHENSGIENSVELFTYEDMKMSFEDLKCAQGLIYEDILINLRKENRGFETGSFKNTVCVHIRMGDFAVMPNGPVPNNKNNLRTPLSWYISVIKKLSIESNKRLRFFIFSDGTNDELKDILNLPYVERKTFGTSIADILGMGQSRLIIASGSSFSLWARFLGQTDCIAYKNQLKASTLIDQCNGIEIEIENAEKEMNSELCRQIVGRVLEE